MALALFFDRGEDLDGDPILGTAGGAFHAQQVVDRCHQNPQPLSEIFLGGMLQKINIAARSGGCAKAIQITGNRHEGEAVALFDGSCVELKWKPRRLYAQFRAELAQCADESLVVLRPALVADVQIVRDRRGSQNAPRHAADDNEADAVLHEHVERTKRIEISHQRRLIRDNNAETLRDSTTSIRSRSAGETRKSCWICVRSTPVPGFISSATALFSSIF